MGIPNFYSWLVKRYPMSQYDFGEQHGHKIDFLFLDMNQVIYQCATNHTILFCDQLRSRDLEEIWIAIFNYLQNIIDLVNPQQLLFMAFDGGAPRAKMNQQRQRRFQSSKHFSKVEDKLDSLGVEACNTSYKGNQITAGSEFMYQLQQTISIPSNQQIKFFIQRKFIEDPRWRNLKVIYSGVDVPGEGEHKILDYIRELKKAPNFCPEWTFMVHSADADLIMLGLSTHLKNFLILRERMPPWEKRKITVAAQRKINPVEFQVINLQIVREYMDLEYKVLKYKKDYHVDRIIDDFIMICFLVGNDFLPRVFCFDIRQGTLELLLLLFKQAQEESVDYLTCNGKINWNELLHWTKRLADFEIVAMERRVKELQDYIKENKYHSKALVDELDMITKLSLDYQSDNHNGAKKRFYTEKCKIDFENNIGEIKDMVHNYLEGLQFVFSYYYNGMPSWEWFYRFYYSPLCSEMHTYLRENVASIDFQFELGVPYPLHRKLVCVLPVNSAQLLPQSYRFLLEDPSSPLRQPIDYFPSDVEIDPFGAFWDHQYIVKLPFVDRKILDELGPQLDEQMTDEERRRSIQGPSWLYIYDPTKLTNVTSTIPNVFPDFDVPLSIEPFDFNSPQHAARLSDLFSFPQTQLQRIPSLKLPSIQQAYLRELKDYERKSKVLTVEQHIHQPDELIQKLSKEDCIKHHRQIVLWVFAGYPVQQFAEVLAVVTPKKVHLGLSVKIPDIQILQEVDYHQQDHKDCYADLMTRLREIMNKVGVDSTEASSMVIIATYSAIKKKSNGSHTYSGMKEHLLPLEWVSLSQQFDLNFLLKKPLQLQDEFRGEVLIFAPHRSEFKRFNGCLAEVKSCIPATDKLIVRPIKKLPDYKDCIYSTDETFYALEFVAKQLKLSIDAILLVLGSVRFIYERHVEELSDGIDVGLNIINMFDNSLVPELVRLPGGDSQIKGFENFNQFRKSLELSHDCVGLIVEYRKRFPQLFEFLATLTERQIQHIKDLKIHDVLHDEEMTVLYQLYIWILQLPSSRYVLCKCASATMQTKDVLTLDHQEKQPGQPENVDILVNAGFVVTPPQNHYVPPFYSNHPPIHVLGSRVINLNSISSRSPKFGAVGTVIGIIDSDTLYIEVLWDEAQIGLSGSRGGPLRSSIVRFGDVFNLTCDWNKFLKERQHGDKGWNHLPAQYAPEFKNKAISTKSIHKKVLKIRKLVDHFE